MTDVDAKLEELIYAYNILSSLLVYEETLSFSLRYVTIVLPHELIITNNHKYKYGKSYSAYAEPLYYQMQALRHFKMAVGVCKGEGQRQKNV